MKRLLATASALALGVTRAYAQTVQPPIIPPANSVLNLPQSVNTIFAGPASGAAAAPTFRALVPADIPTNIRGITPQDYNAKCDDSTDDTAALNAWLAALATKLGGYIPPVGHNCLFSTSLVIPVVNGLAINGGGIGASGLRYIGASTTTTPLSFGVTEGNCSMSSLTLSNFILSSATVMTAGAAAQFNDVCGLRLSNVAIENNSSGNYGNWYNGLIFVGGNQLYLNHNVYTGSNAPIIAYGDGTPITITISVASPAIVTFPNIAALNGVAVKFSTTGALPTGLTAGTTYYIVNSSGTTANVATVPNGTPINTSGTQSGIQSISLLTQLTDLRIYGGIAAGGVIGVDIAGNVGGYNLDGIDLLGNGTELKISQDEVAIPNLQGFLGPLMDLDVTTGGAGRDLDIEDPGSNNSVLNISGTWIASATNSCVYVASGVNIWINWQGGQLVNCGTDGVTNASANDTFQIGGVTVNMTAGGFAASTGYAFNCTVNNNNIFFKDLHLISWGASGEFGNFCQPQSFTSNGNHQTLSSVVNGNTLSPLFGWQYDVSAQNVVTIAAASNAALPTGSGQIIAVDQTSGDTGMYLCGGGVCVLQGTTKGIWVASTTSPASGKESIAYDGSVYRVYNNTGASVNYNISLSRVRSAN